MWRLCPCGYDFGVEVDPPPLPEHGGELEQEGNFLVYRTFWRRFFAGIVDGLVLMPLDWAGNFFTPQSPVSVLILWTVFYYSAYAIYSIFLHARYGQTLGKMVTGVKVLRLSDGAVPGLQTAVLRDIGDIVARVLLVLWIAYVVIHHKANPEAEVSPFPAVVLTCLIYGWFLLEFLTMVADPRRRALHDHIAGTIVVRTESP